MTATLSALDVLDSVPWDRSTQPPTSKPRGRQFEMAFVVTIFVSSQHSAFGFLNLNMNINK